jgi:hypothetical protein
VSPPWDTRESEIVDRHPSTSDTVQLRREILAAVVVAVADGSGHGGDDYSEGWIHGLANTLLYQHRPNREHPEVNDMTRYPLLRDEIAQLMSYTGHYLLRQVMVNRLDAGGRLNAHKDGKPDDWRWHLPIATNPDVQWWDELNGTTHMSEGYWHGPVSYCGVLHAMVNNGATPRVHVVVDFAKVGNGA